MGKAWSDYMAKNAKREYEESDPMKIIDQLRAELAAVKEEQIATLTELQSFREYATALDAHIERLKKALGNLVLDCQRGSGFTVSRPYRKTITEAQAAISSRHTQSLAEHDAALLREVAKLMDPDGGCYEALMAEADRIEKGEK